MSEGVTNIRKGDPHLIFKQRHANKTFLTLPSRQRNKNCFLEADRKNLADIIASTTSLASTP